MTHALLTLAALGATASLASAHVTLAEQRAVVGQSFKANLAIGHGCDGKPTTEIRVRLPEGFIGAKPVPKAGWTISIVRKPYARSYKMYGETVTEGPVEVRWSGGTLEDDWYDEFTVRGTFSGFEKDTRLAFPVTQVCGETSVAWADVPADGVDPHSLAHPAAMVDVVMAQADHDDDHDMPGHDMAAMPGMEAMPGMSMTAAASVPQDAAIAVSGAFARAMLPGTKVGGGYLTIANSGKGADRLVSASSPSAKTVSIHEMKMDGGVMTMRDLAGVDVPAGKAVTFSPGGLHLMFAGVTAPFASGGTVPVTLHFEKAGDVETVLPIGAPNADAP